MSPDVPAFLGAEPDPNAQAGGQSSLFDHAFVRPPVDRFPADRQGGRELGRPLVFPGILQGVGTDGVDHHRQSGLQTRHGIGGRK